MKEYNLKKIYNIYVKIAQAHFVYQPSKPKAITAMPFDWLEAQNLLEKYLKDHGADFDVLRREYVSENVKDDHLPSAQEEDFMKRKDCINYHCEHHMGASIDCCTLKGLGNCPCTKDCPDYVDKAEVYRLGLEALKHPNSV